MLAAFRFIHNLMAISKNGRDGFYKGPVARQLVRGLKAAGGIFTEAEQERLKKSTIAVAGMGGVGEYIIISFCFRRR